MSLRRAFSTTSTLLGHRALIYGSKGEPTAVLRAVTLPIIPPPAPDTLNVRVLATPINPSDVNVIQGVYPLRPSPAAPAVQTASGGGDLVFVGGNEGVAEVIDVGSGVTSVCKGDWVLITKPQTGMWTSTLSVGSNDIIRLNKHKNLSAELASTLTVNPPTAWNMLHDFTHLSPGDYVLQNGANSAVGQNVIQIAGHLGLKTINFVRNRKDIQTLKQHLHGLGADHIFTYDELAHKSLASQIKEITNKKSIRLFLNCVGGRDTQAMAKFLGTDAHMISYGGMSKQPVSLPVSLHIFKNLTSHGFWQAKWYQTHSWDDRQALVDRLTQMIAEGKLQGTDAEVITLAGHKSDAQITAEVHDVMERMANGFGKKVILRIEDTPDVIEGSP